MSGSVFVVPMKLKSSTIIARIGSGFVKPHRRPITTMEVRGVSVGNFAQRFPFFRNARIGKVIWDLVEAEYTVTSMG